MAVQYSTYRQGCLSLQAEHDAIKKSKAEGEPLTNEDMKKMTLTLWVSTFERCYRVQYTQLYEWKLDFVLPI